jgi:Ion channel
MATDERARPPARYGLLLVTLIAAYLVAAVTDTRSGGAIHVAFVAAIGLLAVRHTRPWPWPAWLAAGAALATAVAAGVGATSGSKPAEGAADIWNGLLLLATVVIIVGRVLRLEQVTAQSIYGALSAYLLIGLMFASWFGAIGFLAAAPFFTGGQPANAETVQYFSFTTLTTLGYGDFTAGGSLGRALAVLEAIAGQVFLATLVARLVSAYGTSRRQPPGDLLLIVT